MRGETYRVEITLQNPLPTAVTLSSIEVLTAPSSLRCISARSTVLPAHATITTPVFVMPTACGEIHFTGLRVGFAFSSHTQVQVGHVRSHVISAALPPISSFPSNPTQL